MLSNYQIYIVALLLCGIVSSGIAIWICRLREANISINEKLPRSLLFGVILVAVDLVWCIPHAKPILPESLHTYLIPLAILIFWLAFQFLDYLFSRALGGFMILLAHYLLHASFTFHTSAVIVFPLFCFAIGVLGICFAGKPYLMRDLIRKASCNKKWRLITASLYGVFGLICLFLCIMHIIRD